MSFLRALKGPTYTNTGSVARDHLALERTFLAWLRTGLGFIALGIAVERFSMLDIPSLIKEFKSVNTGTDVPAVRAPTAAETSRHDNTSAQHQKHERLLVGSLLGLGSGSIAYGVMRHFSTMKMLEKGLFKPAYYGAGSLGLAVTALAGASFGNMLNRHQRQETGES